MKEINDYSILMQKYVTHRFLYLITNKISVIKELNVFSVLHHNVVWYRCYYDRESNKICT